MHKRKMSEKQFLMILIAWFVISYAIMWVLGGSCTSVLGFPNNVSVSSVCLSANTVSGLSGVPLAGLILPFNTWVSVMYFFAPIAGFILAFYAITWFNEYFETKQASSIYFLPIAIIVLLLVHGITLAWYYQEAVNGNNARTSSTGVVVSLNPFMCFFEPSSESCSASVDKVNNEYYLQFQKGNSQYLFQYMKVDYWAKMRQSILLLFMLGALAAWVPLFARQFYENIDAEEEHHSHKAHSEHHAHKHKDSNEEVLGLSKSESSELASDLLSESKRE